MEYRRANTDRISHLPSEIIEKILILLPCHEAVRTSILSSDWRYKWMSMSDLNFGQVYPPPNMRSYFWMEFINEFLPRHQGPIRKFSVIVNSSMVQQHQIDQWIKLVSERDIQELKLYSGLRSFGSSSCLFNCKKLTHLQLCGCSLDVPPTFEGFMNLKVLILSVSKVEVESKRSIESLISKSPLLESLSLHIKGQGVSNIIISAPKVKCLSLRGNLKDICLKKSPVLVDMSLHLYGYLNKFFSDAPNLFNSKDLTYLDMSGKMLTVPPIFEGFMNLKSLKLSIRVVDTSSIETLISKSPLLESLSFDSVDSNIPITISAPKMKYLSLRGDLKNIGLEKSPVLVDMRLYLDGDSRDCDLIKLLGAAPDLEKLAVDLGWQHSECFKIGCYRGVLSTTFSYLKVMTVSKFYLGESKAIPLVIELLTSAPNLEKLVIYNAYSHSQPDEADSDFWHKEYLLGHCFMKLKVVEMGDILCKAPEIEFVKFIISKSPVLEKMTIRTYERKKAIINHMLKKLRTLPCASPRVTFDDRDSWRPNCSLEI